MTLRRQEHLVALARQRRIQQVAAEVAARYPLDALRSKKQEVSEAVKTDITGFFAQRGVVVTAVGMSGGMTYENAEIQNSIDNTIIAQQLKVVNEAKWGAQQHDNDRVTVEANAIAERARRIACGEPYAKKIAAAAEAQSIREVTRALADAQQNTLFYQLCALEVERARVLNTGTASIRAGSWARARPRRIYCCKCRHRRARLSQWSC